MCLSEGENVRHRARVEWGIGTITSVERGGIVRVTFEGNKRLSIAKGSNFLIKVDKQGKRI